ncbi:MAG: efflux RND transporter periplasmic adaptor subunit [Betaproteobacteria bacterium]|nr:efflux RND transporter periplasmic adaptor subunit [Betaproteobacteria bacterium]
MKGRNRVACPQIMRVSRGASGKALAVAAALLLAGHACAAGTQPRAEAGPGTEYDCLIEPWRTVEVRSPVTGVIDRIYVDRGSVVHRGDPLLSLDTTVEKAAADLADYKSRMNGLVASAESRLAHAEAKLKRKADLAARHFTSVQERDDAEAEEAIAKADLLAARENRQMAQLEKRYADAQLALRTIRSPIDGIVMDRGMNEGELAEAAENNPYILKLAETGTLRVKAILPLAVYLKVKTGQRVEVTPEKPLNGRYGATISVVDKVIDAASGTFQVRMTLPNPKGSLPGGIKCRVRLPVQ